MSPITLSRLARVLLLSLAAACASEPTSPEGPASLEIVAGDTMLIRGETVRVDARALDARGAPMAGVRFDWSVLDAGIISLEGGRVRALAAGTGRIEARTGALADTVRFRVRAAEPSLGTMTGEMRTPAGISPLEWKTFASFTDVLATEEGDLLVLEARTHHLGTAPDTTLVFIFGSGPSTGERAIGRFPLDGRVPVAEPVALLVVGDWEEVWASIAVGATAFTTAQLPPAPGWDPGRVDGIAALRLVRLEQTPEGLAYSSDTLTLAGEFASRLQHRLRANVRATLSGGPVEGATVRTHGISSDDDVGGILVSWRGDFDGLPGQGVAYEASQAIRLHAPAAGTFALHPITPRELGESWPWPTAFSYLSYRDDGRLGMSTGGTLTITRYLPPTHVNYGEIHGTVEAELELWSDLDTRTGVIVNSSASFAVQVGPLGAVPSATVSESLGSTTLRVLGMLNLATLAEERPRH